MPAPSPLVATVLMAILLSIAGAWIWVILRLALGLPVLPPSTPRIVPWGGGSVLVAVVAWVALNAAVPIAYHAAIRQPRPAAKAGAEADAAPVAKPRRDLTPGEMMTLSAVQNAATLALIPLLLAAISGARPRDFGVEGLGLGDQVIRGVVAYPLLAPLVFGVMGLSVWIWGRTNHPLENAIGQDRSPGMVIILVLAGVVLAPAAEELMFRGVLLGWLTRVASGRRKPTSPASITEEFGGFLPVDGVQHPPETIEIESLEAAPVMVIAETVELATFNPYAYASPAPASVLTTTSEPASVGARSRAFRLLVANVFVSLIFAALHGAVWPTPIPLFFLSLGLGFLYQRTGGLIACTALHMTFNGISTLLMFLMLVGDPVPKPIPTVVDPIPAPVQAAIAGGLFRFDPNH